MSVVDNRIVELIFDNKNFQKGVEDSRRTLKQFDSELDKVGDNHAISGIGRSVNAMSFGGATSAVNNLASRFSALGIIGMTAIENITNRAVNMGISMAKALTIEPVTTGLQEYELKMDNIRTTMVNTGSDLQTVNAVLNDLNTYSDKTIYKFSDMTNALARLTTNGVKDLGLAKNVIQGMANAAAYAGLDNTKLQSIMYNTSQAYSLGYMSLMDFRSLENAGIGNKFKEVAIETAVELGTLQKQADGTYKSIVKGEKSMDVTVENMRNTLQGKWLTNDVMTKVFEKYADESTALGKAASDAATQITTASKLWDTWKEAAQSGWAQNWELIIGDYEEAKQLWTSLNEVVAGQNGFLTKFSNGIADALKEWRTFSGRQLMIRGFKNLWSGFTKVVGSAKEAFKDIFPDKYGNLLVDVTRKFYRFSRSVIPTAESLEKLKSVFKGVFSVFKIGGNVFSSIGRILRLMIPSLKGTAGGFLDNAASLGDLVTGLADYLEKNDSIFKSLKKVYDIAKRVFDFLANIGRGLVKTIEDTFGIDIRIPTFDEILNAMTNIKNFFKPVTSVFTAFKTLVTTGFTKVKETLGSVFSKDGIFGSGGVGVKPVLGLAAALYALFHIKEGFDPFKLLLDIFDKGLSKALDFTGILDDLGDALSGFVANIRVDALLKASIALALLTGSLVVLSAIDPSKIDQAVALIVALGAGIVAVGDAMAGMFSAFGSWKTGFQNMMSAFAADHVAGALIKFAAALAVMAGALWLFSKVEPDKLGVALLGLAASFVGLVGAMMRLKDIGVGAVAIGAGLMSIAVGVLVMAGALKLLSTMSWEELGVGLTGLAASLVGLVVALKLLDDVKFTSMAGIAVAALGMGVALVALAAALKLLSTISDEDMTTAIRGLASGLVLIGMAIAGLSLLSPTDLLAASAALVVASVALIGFAVALSMLSIVGEAAAPALEILSGTLLAVAIALAALSFIPAGDLLAAAAAMLIVSFAMMALSASVLILAAGMAMLNGVEIGGIADGFLALAGPLALTGAALVVVAAGIAALSAALLLFAPAVLVLDGVAIAFGAFAVAAELVAGAIGSSAASFDLFVGAVERLANVKDGISGAGKAIGTAIKEMLSATRSASSEFQAEGVAIMQGIQAGIDSTPLTIDSALQNMLNVSEMVFDVSPIVNSIITSLSMGLSVIDFGGIIGSSLTAAMAMVDGTAMEGAAQSMVASFTMAFTTASSVGSLRDAGTHLANEAVTGAKSVDTISAGAYFVQGFAQGIDQNTFMAEARARAMALQALQAAKAALGVRSPSREMKKVGGYFVEGFAIGIGDGIKMAITTAANMAREALAATDDMVSDGIAPVFDTSNVYDAMRDFDGVWRPTIRPTLDMSGVNPGTLNATAVASQQASGYRFDGTPGGQGSAVSAGQSFNFTQNNYSPKPLSRTEIYRQTKNQFAAMEGLVSTR